jgi:hypothetical protein
MKALIIAALAAATTSILSTAHACEATSGAGTAALVELYTSEGCSSCPPADRWFATLAAKTDPGKLNLLSFHVDYWDSLGWSDRYAQHAFSQRQSARVHATGSAAVYTPQVMLSARPDLRWYRPDDVAKAIASEQARPSQVALKLRAGPAAHGWRVTVDGKPNAGVEGKLYLALYQDRASTRVAAGENAGSVLTHARVVRKLWGPWPIGAHEVLAVAPEGTKAGAFGLTAFVQDAAGGRTLQALGLPLGSCGAGL